MEIKSTLKLVLNVTCRARKGASMNGETTLGTGLHSLIIIRYPIMQTNRRRLSPAKRTRTTGPGEEPHQSRKQAPTFQNSLLLVAATPPAWWS